MASTIPAPSTRNGRPGSTTDQSRPAMPPTCQNRKRSSVSWLETRMTFISEKSPALSAAPARASFTGVAPSRPSEAMR